LARRANQQIAVKRLRVTAAKASASRPGQLVLGQPSAGIMHLDLVRQIRSPSPQNQICHVGARACRKRRRQDPSRALRDQRFRYLPGGGDLAVCKVIRPWTPHGRDVDGLSGTPRLRPQIDDVIDIDVVAADRQGIETVGKPMPHLDEHAFCRQSEIQRRRADGIEASAFGRRSVAR
jgi:hypothetical protein